MLTGAANKMAPRPPGAPRGPDGRRAKGGNIRTPALTPCEAPPLIPPIRKGSPPPGLGSFRLSVNREGIQTEELRRLHTLRRRPEHFQGIFAGGGGGGNRTGLCPSTPDHLSPFSPPIGSHNQLSISTPPPLKTRALFGGSPARRGTDTMTVDVPSHRDGRGKLL